MEREIITNSSQEARLGSFWSRNLNLYRLSGLPFESDRSIYAYLNELKIRFGADKDRLNTIYARVIQGRRWRISCFRYMVIAVILAAFGWFMTREPQMFREYLIAFLSLLLFASFSFFYSLELDFRKLVRIIAEIRKRETVESIVETKDRELYERDALLKQKIADAQTIHDERVTAALSFIEDSKTSKAPVSVTSGDEQYLFTAWELLLIEYFKFRGREKGQDRDLINFDAFKPDAIIEMLQQKYSFSGKEERIRKMLHASAFLDLKVSRNAYHRNSNMKRMESIDRYLFESGFLKAKELFGKHLTRQQQVKD